MNKLFNRFIDRGVFEFEIFASSKEDKIKLWICPPDPHDVTRTFEVTTFADIARSLEEYADMCLKDDEGE